jgi:S1-C subfamily serine protease
MASLGGFPPSHLFFPGQLHHMSHTDSPRFRTPKNTSFGLSISLLLAGFFFGAGELLAAPEGSSTRAYNGSVESNHQGVRYVYVQESPENVAIREEVLQNSHDVPAPNVTNLIGDKHPAVVRIDVEGAGNVVYHGSGALVMASEKKGLVITNWHVIRDAAGTITVRFPDGFTTSATVVKTDRTWDLAALSTARPNAQPVKLSASVPKIGDALTVAGYGSGTYRQSSGRLLQYCAPGMTEPNDIIEVTTAARNGDSGGPIFALDGTLAGVLFGSISGTTNGSHVGRVRHFLQSVLIETPYADLAARRN